MSKEILKVTQEFMTIDLLLWRRFAQETPRAVEKTAAANRSLVELGPYLPVGASVEIEIEEVRSAPAVRVVRLWG